MTKKLSEESIELLTQMIIQAACESSTNLNIHKLIKSRDLNDLHKAALCKSLDVLQNQNKQAFNVLDDEIKKHYSNQIQKSSSHTWNQQYEQYLQDCINKENNTLIDNFDDLLDLFDGSVGR